MKYFEEPGSLIIVRVDHLSGEMLGEIREQLSSKGAKNVQLLSTLTKKGRPGHLLLIDIAPERMSELENFLVSDLGVCGWHRLLSEHVHVGTEVVSRELIFRQMAAFQEGLAEFSGGPLNPPLGHILADAVVAFKALPAMEWDKAAVADALVELRQNISIDLEVALVSMNTIARKAAELRPVW